MPCMIVQNIIIPKNILTPSQYIVLDQQNYGNTGRDIQNAPW